MTSFAKRFKKLREKNKWTQDETAEKLGVSRPTIAGYESEEKSRIPREETLIRIADLFMVSLDYLLGRTDDPTPIELNTNPLHDPNVTLAFKDLDRLTPEQLEEVKAFILFKIQLNEK